MSARRKTTRRALPRWLATVFLLLAFWGAAPAAGAAVTVYYFHSTARCAECLQIEQLAGEILQQTFARQLADGRLLWCPVNADLPQNTHFVFDFELAANELVVAWGAASQRDEWDKLPEVWNLAHDPERLRAALVPMVRQALAKTD